MKLSKEELQYIKHSLKESIEILKNAPFPPHNKNSDLIMMEYIRNLQDLHDKIANEIVRICEKTKLSKLK